MENESESTAQCALVEYQSIKREAEGDKKLYENLVRKIKKPVSMPGFRTARSGWRTQPGGAQRCFYN